MSIFEKDLRDIDESDLNKLISDKISEDERLEFKETLSSNKGPDSWIEGKDKVGDKALITLIKEIVAFANTEGGFLILGMKESDEIKPKAKKLTLIPRIVELTEKLKHQIRDLIEPTLINIRYKELELNSDKGVLIIRVERSQNAPHRSLKDKECYIRRNDRSEKMTMREIKDIAFLRLKNDELLISSFENRKKIFENNLESKIIPYRFSEEQDENRLGLRVTLIPVNENIFIHDVYKKFDYMDFKFNQRFKANLNGEIINSNLGYKAQNKYPIIRGVRFYDKLLNFEIQESGLIEATLVDLYYPSIIWSPMLHIKWLFELVYRSLLISEKVKKNILGFNFEYAIEIQLISSVEKMNVGLFHHRNSGYLEVFKKNVLFPRYSFLGVEEIEKIFNLIAKDFYAMCELDFKSSLNIPEGFLAIN